MFADQWSKILIASVAPVVVISASGLLCLAFYNRLAAIVTRLRMVQRERLQEQLHYRAAVAKQDTDAVRHHRRLLDNLGSQTERIIGRAYLIRQTLLCLQSTVGLLILASLFNGAAFFWPPVAAAAAVAFVLGMLCLLYGVITAMRELGRSLDVVELETQLVSELTDYDAEADGATSLESLPRLTTKPPGE